ncbi:MAG: selenocysteine lyase/cysteine desulfurase [Candidatus Azotimanducaceae bacterium]|jgi:isopenicillin-N epimerase
MVTRRVFLSGALATAALPALNAYGAMTMANHTLATDEAYWAGIRKLYDLKPDMINVENGYWGMMARPVLEQYITHTENVNRDNSWFARREFGKRFRHVTETLATSLNVGPDEIALTRGATEALQALMSGYRGLKAGDAVMYADLDYGSMQMSLESKANQEGADIIRLEIPEPVSYEGLIEFYTQAMADAPKTRLLLLTHISHRTGLVIPVKEITEIAKSRGIDVIVDAAHSWGQLDFSPRDLGADFIGFNLHKWIGAPIGVGALYIRQARLADIAPNPSASANEYDKVTGRAHTGTSNFAAILTVPDALEFHASITASAKAARLQYLRNEWVKFVADTPEIKVLTGEDPRLHAGITSFRIKGRTSTDDNRAIVAKLLDESRIFTVHRTGVAAGACVRITPGIYNTTAEMHSVGRAIRALAPA